MGSSVGTPGQLHACGPAVEHIHGWAKPLWLKLIMYVVRIEENVITKTNKKFIPRIYCMKHLSLHLLIRSCISFFPFQLFIDSPVMFTPSSPSNSAAFSPFSITFLDSTCLNLLDVLRVFTNNLTQINMFKLPAQIL